ncbi:nucleotidyl transferase AbiEii/AbiGii toxin family protein [Nocardia sp. NPDC087230]|uniref:nucleotidyl transferase AbiEii/AbiGii toxin family protein n=1 Tax=Nocardia sp. NPDC087230 TaxID=3364331 RepID=UPI00380E2C75
MTLDLSKSTDPEIALAAAVLLELDAAAARAGIEFLVVGATARNMVARSITGSTPARATRDVDIAVVVADWSEVRRLGEMFGGRQELAHRFEIDGVPVDVIPCGAIESPARTVAWPNDFTMHTLGFREAFRSSQSVLLPGPFAVRIPSVAAQVLLKLVAWYDRHWDSTKDAIDLRTMLEWTDTGPLLERMYEENADIVELYDYDVTLAGAHGIGKAIRGLLDRSALAQVSRLLADRQLQVRLAGDMQGVFNRSLQQLDALAAGVTGNGNHLGSR